MAESKTKAQIQVRLPHDFLAEIDRRAHGKYLSRNGYILACIQQVMNIDDAKAMLWERVLSKWEKDPNALLTDDEKVAIKTHTEPFSFL